MTVWKGVCVCVCVRACILSCVIKCISYYGSLRKIFEGLGIRFCLISDNYLTILRNLE